MIDSRDPNRLAAYLESQAEDWADKDAAANLLEETKKTVLAKVFNSLAGRFKGVAEREFAALGSPAYVEHVTAMVEARRVANVAKAKLEATRVYLDLIRTKEATQRVLMQHPGR
jgi:hypothetical protein